MTKPQMISRDIARVALVLAILPTAVININYLIAASEGYVPWCVPYWDSCTSISATGREGSAFFFFKSTMIPIAFIYLWYWKLADQALAETDHSPRTIANIGIIACVALICYTGVDRLAGRTPGCVLIETRRRGDDLALDGHRSSQVDIPLQWS